VRSVTLSPVPSAVLTWAKGYVHKTRGTFAAEVRRALDEESGLVSLTKAVPLAQAAKIVGDRERWVLALGNRREEVLKKVTIRAARKLDSKGNRALMGFTADLVSGSLFHPSCSQ